MSRVERVESLLRQIEDETRVAFDEHTQLYHKMQSLESENAKLRDMCSELYRRYWDVEGDFFIDPEMGKLEEKLRELGIGTWEAWQ